MIKIEERGAWRLKWRRAVLLLASASLAAVLAACGGGGGAAGTSLNPGTPASSASTPASSSSSPTTTGAADLVIVLSKTSIVNSGTDSLTATVTAIDANRDTVANVPVTFKVDGNAIATAAGSTTGSDGTVRASISEGSDNSTRTVNVTATSGSITRSVSFSVVQAPPASTTPQAADLTLSLDASTVNNSGSVAVNATAIAVDANRNALAGIPVQFAVDSNAVIVPGGTQTDSNGKVPGAVTIGSDHSNRTITVTATSGTLVRTAAFRVVGAALQATAVPTVLTAGAAGNQINYTLVDFNKNPMSNQAITVTGSGLPSASAKTDSNGQYSYVYTAPSTPGALTITASAGGATASTTVTVPSGTTTVPTVTTTVSSATLTLSPNVVQVNTNGTNNIATLSTLFVSASNAPIPNIRVRYDLNGDPLSVGGTIGAGANVIYADASGTAISTYAPGAIASPTNGVTIRACWDYADFAAGTCPNQVTKTLTVVASPISISIGTNNQISTGPSGLTYVKKYVLLVVDPAGNPKPDVQLSVSLDLNGYYKGFYGFDSVQKIWTQQYWSGSAASATDVLGLSAMCGNEDVNRNGVIDAGEDANGNSQLDPRKSDASISLVGSTKTDSNGIAVLQLEYPQSVATWVNFTISANAAGVLSPPALLTSILPAASADLTTQNPPPAFQYSPYGQRRDTTTDKSLLNPSGILVTNLCTNTD